MEPLTIMLISQIYTTSLKMGNSKSIIHEQEMTISMLKVKWIESLEIRDLILFLILICFELVLLYKFYIYVIKLLY